MELFRKTRCQTKMIEILLDMAVGVLDREGTPSDGTPSRVLEVSSLVVRRVRDLVNIEATGQERNECLPGGFHDYRQQRKMQQCQAGF